MVLIVLGTGMLKPNVSSIVGEIYSEEDARRDAGFSIFYMGINLGGFLAPLIVGTIGMNVNFHLGFGLAAIGMFLGLAVFLSTKKKLGTRRHICRKPTLSFRKTKVMTWIGLGVVIIILLLALTIPTGYLTFQTFSALIGLLGILIPTLYFIVMYRSPKTTSIERSRIIAYIPLLLLL